MNFKLCDHPDAGRDTDWMANQMMEIEGVECFDAPRAEPDRTTWVTRDGYEVKVGDMTDNHLVNTVNYLRRHYQVVTLRCWWMN